VGSGEDGGVVPLKYLHVAPVGTSTSAWAGNTPAAHRATAAKNHLANRFIGYGAGNLGVLGVFRQMGSSFVVEYDTS
jgi:hypothetical protein